MISSTLKTVILSTLLLILSTLNTLNGQERTKKQIKLDKKEMKREMKAKKKEGIKQKKILEYNSAISAIEANHWVIEAKSLQAKSGFPFKVNPSTNFISREGNNVYVQIASPMSSTPGSNGIGGVTVMGNPMKEEKIYDKKGNLTYTMTIKSSSVTADITFTMGTTGNHINAEFRSYFHGGGVIFDGNILPLSESAHFRSGSGL